MSLFRRITATLSASMDSVVGRVEDHDAIIESSIYDCRKAASRIKVRLARVQKDGQQLRQRKNRTEQDLASWTERALNTMNQDEGTALQCLKRKQQSEAQLQQITESLQQFQQSEKQLRQNLAEIQFRLSEISQKRNTMRSRQSVSEATRILNKVEDYSNGSLDETFDRWEARLLETEMLCDSNDSVDSFENAFIESEEKQALKAELQLLAAQQEG